MLLVAITKYATCELGINQTAMVDGATNLADELTKNLLGP